MSKAPGYIAESYGISKEYYEYYIQRSDVEIIEKIIEYRDNNTSEAARLGTLLVLKYYWLIFYESKEAWKYACYTKNKNEERDYFYHIPNDLSSEESEDLRSIIVELVTRLWGGGSESKREWKQIEDYDFSRPFHSYLKRYASNTASELFRKKKNKYIVYNEGNYEDEEGVDKHMQNMPDTKSNNDIVNMFTHENIRKIKNMCNFSEKDSLIFNKRFENDEKYEDIYREIKDRYGEEILPATLRRRAKDIKFNFSSNLLLFFEKDPNYKNLFASEKQKIIVEKYYKYRHSVKRIRSDLSIKYENINEEEVNECIKKFPVKYSELI